MIGRISWMYSLLWRLLWCAFPFVTEYASAAISASHNTSNVSMLSNESVRNIASNYSDSLLTLACIFFLGIGTMVGYFHPTPKYGLKPYPKFIKVLISVGMGSLAFLYYLETNQQITPAVCIYVAGVSFVGPAIIHLIHAAAIKGTSLNTGVTDEDLDRINRSFQDEDPK